MLSLLNIPSSDASKMPQRHSQSMFDHQEKKMYLFLFTSVFSDSYNVLLPIKPKPLLYPKDSTFMSDSHHNSKVDQMAGDAILVSYFLISYIIQKRQAFLSMRLN
jgi:hypothetical protein